MSFLQREADKRWLSGLTEGDLSSIREERGVQRLYGMDEKGEDMNHIEDLIHSKEWLKTISLSAEMWADDSIDSWPSIIAYEYRLLHRLCEEEQPYGVLICLKDNFEIFLKLEVLLSFSWADQNMDEDFRKRVISQITTPNLTMGAWMDLAKILVKETEASGKILPDELPLKEVRKYYNKKNIVNWRNRKIGHGAMELEEDEEFREELIKKIEDLKGLYDTFDEVLKEQRLYIDALQLKGPDMARGLDLTGKISCVLGKSGTAFSVDPYILIRKHEKRGSGVYFFDNQKTKTLTVFQTYADGSQSKEPDSYFERLRRELETGTLHLSAQPDDPYLVEAENRELEVLQMSHSFVEPTHLKKWLTECIEHHDKGIFLLQMERGTGKSVFSEKLNRLYKGALVLDDELDVRTYHFSRTQSVGISDVYNRIEWSWASQYEGSAWYIPNGSRIMDHEREGDTPAKAFCRFLGDALGYTRRNRGRDSILMVLDGLDEITEERCWDLLPDTDMLPEGVYLLLTSRNPETETGLPKEIESLEKQLNVTDKMVYGRVQKENVDFLNHYIKSAEIKNLSEERISLLLGKADYRVLYLGMLCKLIKQGLDINQLPDNEKVVETYLDTLGRCYGEKEGIRIREILAVLATLGEFEPLSMKEIAALTAEGMITLKLIGMMRDLAPMLKVERSSEGNRYRVANPDLAEELKKQLPEIEETVLGLMELGIDQVKGGYPLEMKAVDPVIAHLVELSGSISSNKELFNEEILGKLSAFSDHADIMAKTAQERRRVGDYYTQQLLCSRIVLGEEHPDTLYIMENIGDVFREIGWYEKDASLREIVLEIRERILGEGHPNTLESMDNLVSSYKLLGRYERATSLCERTLVIRKRIWGEEHIGTLGNMDSLSTLYEELGWYEDAVAFREKVMEILKLMPREEDSVFLYICMNNLGESYRRLGRYEKAVDIHKQAIESLKHVRGRPFIDFHMNNLGVSYSYLGRHEEAASLHEQTLEIRKNRTEGVGKQISMINLGNSYRDLGRNEEAAVLHKKVLDIQRHILGEEHPVTLNNMNNLGVTYRNLGRYEEAVILHEQVLDIQKRVKGETDSDTLYNMDNLGTAYSDLGRYEEAASLREHVFKIRKRVLGKEHHDVLSSMNNLGMSLSDLGRYEEAASLHEQVLEIRKRLLGEKHSESLNSMINLERVYIKLSRFEEAATLHERALEIWNTMLGGDHPEMKKYKFEDLGRCEEVQSCSRRRWISESLGWQMISRPQRSV